jgi:hypothetical protein
LKLIPNVRRSVTATRNSRQRSTARPLECGDLSPRYLECGDLSPLYLEYGDLSPLYLECGDLSPLWSHLANDRFSAFRRAI